MTQDCSIQKSSRPARSGAQRGSVLVIVLWITFGLISLSLYFANSMTFELRASDNRVAAQAAEQAIEGAVRYINYLLTTQIANGSNGWMLDPATYANQAVPIGSARVWLIGRDTNIVTSGPGHLCFGLVDEASKLNLNSLLNKATTFSNQLIWLPTMTLDLAQAILDWRDTNGTGATVTYYSMQQPPYLCKDDPFETVDELRMVYGADMDVLIGEDANRNGVLDPNETDANQNNMLDPGVLEYVTVYSREPVSSSAVNLSNLGSGAPGLYGLLQTNLPSGRADQIFARLGLSAGGGAGGRTTTGGAGGRGGTGGAGGAGGAAGGRMVAAAAATVSFTSPLQFYVRSGMSLTEFALIATNLSTTSNSTIDGRVNVNTASAAGTHLPAGRRLLRRPATDRLPHEQPR